MSDNVYDISLDVLVNCVNEKKDYSLLVKESIQRGKVSDKKVCVSICGIVLRNYFLIKYFANHVLHFEDIKLVLATGIVFGTVAFKKVEKCEECVEWYKNLLKSEGIEFDEEKEKAIKELIEKKKNYNFKDLNKGSLQYFSISNNLPIWFVKMLYKQYGRDIMYKVCKECSKMPKQFGYQPSFIELTDDEKISLLDFDELSDNFYSYKFEKSIKSVSACHTNSLFPVQMAEHKMITKLPVLENKEVTLVLNSSENGYVEIVDKYYKNNLINVLFKSNKKYFGAFTKFDKSLNSNNFKYHEFESLTLDAYVTNKQDLIVYFAKSSNFDMFRRIPDYIINYSPSLMDEGIASQEEGLNALAKYVEVNGKLVYCVPTINIKETKVQVMKFLESNKDFVEEYSEFFFPYEKDNSIYYYTILRKTK